MAATAIWGYIRGYIFNHRRQSLSVALVTGPNGVPGGASEARTLHGVAGFSLPHTTSPRSTEWNGGDEAFPLCRHELQKTQRADAEDYLQRTKDPRRLQVRDVGFEHKAGERPPERRTSEGASIGESANSTAGGAAGQLTAKD